MKSMYIGSGDVSDLLKGKHTKGFQNLLRRFCSDEIPGYNAFASPIDALRTGAILEERYYLILPDGYYPQYRVKSGEMDVFSSSIDFAKLNSGKVVDFDELKTCFMTDFLDFQPLKGAPYDTCINYIKKYYKNNYSQIQQQLYTTELDEANLVFLEVFTYDDDENKIREIKENEYIKFRIRRDEAVISQIKERGQIFQQIKDYFNS
jgi:hypothetical protein